MCKTCAHWYNPVFSHFISIIFLVGGFSKYLVHTQGYISTRFNGATLKYVEVCKLLLCSFTLQPPYKLYNWPQILSRVREKYKQKSHKRDHNEVMRKKDRPNRPVAVAIFILYVKRPFTQKSSKHRGKPTASLISQRGWEIIMTQLNWNTFYDKRNPKLFQQHAGVCSSPKL